MHILASIMIRMEHAGHHNVGEGQLHLVAGGQNADMQDLHTLPDSTTSRSVANCLAAGN